MANATPRDLDPKFTETKPVEGYVTPDATEADVKPKDQGENPKTKWISHTRRWVDNDGQSVEKIDRMSMADWPEYKEKYNL